MTDSIHLGRMLSFHAWEQLCFRRGWADLCRYTSLEQAASLFFRLRLEHDNETDFPHGKWASLQELERLIEEAIKAEPAEAPEWIEGACPECERWQTTGHRRSCSKFKPAALEGAMK